MILLEFRSLRSFQVALKILGRDKVSCIFEPSTVEWRPSLIYFFADDLHTERQRKAVVRARSLERIERSQKQPYAWPNLAVPL